MVQNPDPFDQELMYRRLEEVFGKPAEETISWLVSFAESTFGFDKDRDWMVLLGSWVYAPERARRNGSDVDINITGQGQQGKVYCKLCGKDIDLFSFQPGSFPLIWRSLAPCLVINSPGGTRESLYRDVFLPQILRGYEKYCGDISVEPADDYVPTRISQVCRTLEELARKDHPKMKKYEFCNMIKDFDSKVFVKPNGYRIFTSILPKLLPKQRKVHDILRGSLHMSFLTLYRLLSYLGHESDILAYAIK